MTYDVNATFGEEQAKREGSEPIDLYVVNGSMTGFDPYYYANYNQQIIGYCVTAADTVGATEVIYTGLKIERGEIQSTVSGEISEVSISVPNPDRAMEAIIEENDYLRGLDIQIISTYTKFLPSGSTFRHIGTDPDRNSYMLEKLYVDGVQTDDNVVTFSCKPKFTIKNIFIPGRRFSRQCAWQLSGRYLGSECDLLASVNSVTYPTCDGSLEQCELRTRTEHYGGFPSIPQNAFLI